MRLSLVFLLPRLAAWLFSLPLKRRPKFHYHRRSDVSTSANRRAGPRGSAASANFPVARRDQRTLAASRVFNLLERLARIAERVHAGRDPAIDSDLKQDLLDLFFCESVLQRTLDVQLQLVGPVECAQHRQIDDAAGTTIEARPRP